MVNAAEIWKDIRGYEGLYQVSNLGRIKSTSPGLKFVKGSPSELIMKQSLSSSGYLHVQLYKAHVPATVLVHKVVAQAFIDNPEGKPEVNHIDSDRTNNRVSNLEWATKSENMKHSFNRGYHVSPMLNRKGAMNTNSKKIIQYDLSGNEIRRWTGIAEAARSIGCNPSSISACLCGYNKTCKGHVWKYETQAQAPSHA